jgi:hypothetical protein
MAKHHTDEQIPEVSLAREFEQRDLSNRMLGFSLVGLAVLTVGAILVMALYLGAYRSSAARNAAPPLPVGPAETTPPEPRLENTPAEIRTAYEANLETLMNSYLWLERDASVARIPVERAKAIVAREGLPIDLGVPAETEQD